MNDDALSIEEFESLVGGRVESIEPLGARMGITKEFLTQEIANLEQQFANAMATAHMAKGAIQGFRALIEKLDKEEADGQSEES